MVNINGKRYPFTIDFASDFLWYDGDGDDFDDDERKKSKKTNFSSNDRSGHDDQNSYWIIQNGAILGG